jgi:CHAT domain-containing protein/tetratricopeptide (TPR) repeat protein
VGRGSPGGGPKAADISPEEQAQLRRYLLGRLGEAEEEAVELRLLTDPDYSEESDIVADELIDQYAEGKIPAAELDQFEKYFLRPQVRKDKLNFALALRKRKRELRWAARFYRVYLPAAAALLLVGVGVIVWRAFYGQSEVDKGLVALQSAYREQRPVEARITDFGYAPALQQRGGGAKIDYVQRDRAASLLLGAVAERPSADSHRALGQYYLTANQYEQALGQLRAALGLDPGDAKSHSDLGAALLEAGKAERLAGDESKSLEHFAEALGHFDRALQLEPARAEALFNRALCLQNMGMPDPAREAWKKYLELDRDSEWAGEARRSLRALEEKKEGARDNGQLTGDFLAAYHRGDDEAAWRLASRNREMITGRLIPRQLARAFLSLSSEGKGAAAAEALSAFRYAGELEYRRTGDPYFKEMAGFYASAPRARLAVLERAQGLLSEGHDLCLRGKYKEALAPFGEARLLLGREGDEWGARLAEYWVGYGYYQTSRPGESLALLAALSGYCERGGYKWLLMQSAALTANALGAVNELSKSLEYNHRSLELAEALSDTYAEQKALSQLANLYRYLGVLDRSLGYLHRCLRIAGDGPQSTRQAWRNYEIASQTLYALGLNSAAAAYGRESLRLCLEEGRDPATTYITYLHLGLIYAKLRDFAEAVRLAREGLLLSESLGKDATVANSLLHLAHLNRYAGRCDEALGDYERAIRIYDRLEESYQRYDAHKGRLLCHVALDDDTAARRELPEVLRLFESYRPAIAEERNRNSFFDAEQGVYDLAIGYAYGKWRDPELAFKYSEDSRARTLVDLLVAGEEDVLARRVVQPADLRGVRERLPAGVQLVQYAALEDRLLIWLVSREQFEVFESKVAAVELEAKVLNFLRLLRADAGGTEGEAVRREAESLYELLVAPVEPLLARGGTVVLVPDKALGYLPFAALVSPRTGEYLVHEHALVSASSANVFLLCTEAARRKAGAAGETLLSVGNPSFDGRAFRSLPDLPSAAREAEEVARLYGGGALLGPDATKEKVVGRMDRADVIHFAGHYVVDERSPELSHLLLARSTAGEDAGVLRMREVMQAGAPRARLVVLSACNTAIERYYRGECAVGLSRSFLAAGVPLVVATQWAVDSEATAALMTGFHRHRKRGGLNTAEALRRAQLEMAAGADEHFRRPYFWAGFTLVGGHADY